MSLPVIRVHNLGKRYRIGGLIGGNGYKTLRETLMDIPKTLFRRFHGGLAYQDEIIWALKDVSFQVKQGEVVGIIGRNGAGKTTLLKILTRITEPTEGYAEIRGRVGSLLEVGTGFHPELTGRENIFLNGAILGMKRTEIKRKFDEIVAFAEIEKFIDTPVKRYSSGMYVRLAFAVAAHLEPEILLVDEVLAVGDVGFQKKCLGKMGDVAKEGRTVLFVSHNMAAIKNLCERALLLNDGRLVLDASAGHTIAQYLDQNLLKGAVALVSEIKTRMYGRIRKKNPYIRFQEIALLDSSGIPRNLFYSDENIVVSVTFECLQPVQDLRVKVYIVDENNVPILATQNVDDPNVITNFYHLAPGFFNASCNLPGNTFGGRLFFLTVHLAYPRIENLYVDKILEFKIEFRGYNNVHYGSDAEVFIRPQLNWTVQPAQSEELGNHAR